ncbi:MAG: ORF6N domain-containing protein [Betaproteobacteria bacterium]
MTDIIERIVVARGQRVILDSELALLYRVETRVLVQAVKRNRERFPPEFCFRLTNQDIAVLRSQSVMSKRQGRGGRSSTPFAFTEHGAIMAATVLKSAAAIALSVYVVRASARTGCRRRGTEASRRRRPTSPIAPTASASR